MVPSQIGRIVKCRHLNTMNGEEECLHRMVVIDAVNDGIRKASRHVGRLMN